MARHTSARHFVVTVLVGAFGALLVYAPSSSADYGSPATADDTTRYTFGWSAASELSAPGAPVPITLQYTKQTEGCPQGGDGNDEPVHAFRFFNTRGQARVQIVQPNGLHNRRLIGTDLHDARKENSASILSHPQMDDDERRPCPPAEGTNLNTPSADTVFWGKHDENTTVVPAQSNQYLPQDFDDHEWLAAPYYLPNDNSTGSDGRGKVYVLMHQESRVLFAAPNGPDDPYCTFPDSVFANACWFTSITFSESTDVANCRQTRSNWTPLPVGSNATPNTVGACYMHNDQLANPFLFPPSDLTKHIVAAIPYQYYKNWGCTPTDVPPDYGSTYQGGPCGRHGYKEHSSVIKARPGEGSSDMANKYFTIAAVSAPIFNSDSQLANLVQKPGLCLLQTNDLGNPDSWLGWNGRSFAVDLRSGYNLPPGGNPDNHVCEAAVPGMSAMHPWSLTYNRYLKKYMLEGSWPAPGQSRQIHYLLSDDLRNWSAPQLLMNGPIGRNGVTACLDTVVYPSVIDPDDPAKDWLASDPSGNPNFDHPGPTPDIYFNHDDVLKGANPGDPCTLRENGNGNLGRMAIDLRPQRQATLESGVVNPTWGFDRTETAMLFERLGNDQQPEKFGYGERDLTNAGSQKFAQAQLWGSVSRKPHGITDVKWKNNDEVWYGAAYFLPANFQNVHGNHEILRWDAPDGEYGGVGLRTSDRKFHLVRGTTAGSTDIGDRSFNLPTGRWTWLEVHQRFGQSAGESPYSEVFVDGELVSSSMDPNRSSDAAISKLGVGYVSADPTYNLFTSMSIDRASILGGQRGAFKGPGIDQAPDTPTGLTAYPGQTSASVFANTVPTATGYKFYRRNKTQPGLWNRVHTGPGPAFQDLNLACNTTYEYRVTAYRQGPASFVESIVSNPITSTTTVCP